MNARRRVSIAVRVAAVVGLTTLGAWPVDAKAAPDGPALETVEVPSLAEAWYAKPETPAGVPALPGLPEAPLPLPEPCSLPIGCPPEPPVPLPVKVPDDPADAPAAAYPAGTLHLELSLGRTTGRAFLVPDLTQLPFGSELISGELVLPLSEEPTSGNRGAATARFGACLTTSEVTDLETGRLVGAPTFDCEIAATEAVFVPGTKAFVVDLTPFIATWKAGAPNFGVALVPTVVDDGAGALAAESTWHVAVNGSRVETGDASRSVLQVEPAAEVEPETPTETPVPEPSGAGTDGGLAPVSTGGGIVTPDPPVAPAAVPSAPVLEAVPAVPLDSAPYALINSPWYTYRGVVFLPLAFLVALSLTGRSLTRPLAAIGRRRLI